MFFANGQTADVREPYKPFRNKVYRGHGIISNLLDTKGSECQALPLRRKVI